MVTRLETALQPVAGLQGSSLDLEVMSSPSDNRPGNPAAFRTSTGRVEVYDPEFFGLSPAAQLGVLAHEVGEFSAASKIPELASVAELPADFQADYFACLVGFENELLEGRGDRGAGYAEAVRSWGTSADFVAGMSRWRNMRNAGLR